MVRSTRKAPAPKNGTAQKGVSELGKALRKISDGCVAAGGKGAPQLREMALRILEDPDRVFLASPFVRLEMLPKAIFNLGEKEAARSGVGSMDSLHIAAAHLLKADAFITTERPTKSIHRSSLVKSSVCSSNL